ncbi:hypothetical protein [Acidovorax sp. NB1]|uniref:hypothetical protein n=1 Tax=Acidovorax sp. NB1 TaxID=1943571 RepID=UPI0010F9C58D|nr:hypothetical protein [Acidovorax sp. NB1]
MPELHGPACYKWAALFLRGGCTKVQQGVGVYSDKKWRFPRIGIEVVAIVFDVPEGHSGFAPGGATARERSGINL